MTCLSPTKTFNLAGIQVAMLVASDPIKREKLQQHAFAHGPGYLNAFAASALVASYEQGDAWLADLLDVLSQNKEYAIQQLSQRLPELKIMSPQATYLMWIDYRSLHLSEVEIMDRLLTKGKIALEP